MDELTKLKFSLLSNQDIKLKATKSKLIQLNCFIQTLMRSLNSSQLDFDFKQELEALQLFWMGPSILTI